MGKNDKNFIITNETLRRKYGTISSAIGICVNIILAGGKIAVGMLFSSLSLISDGVNNFSDAGSSVVTLVGFKMASKRSDSEHPFGHARIEYVSGLIIAFIIIFLGAQLLISSIEKIIAGNVMQYSVYTLIALAVSIVCKLALAIYYKGIAKKIESAAIKAAATDSINDVYVSAGILLSILLFLFTKLQIDSYVSLALSLYIIFSGIMLAKETISPLLGEAPHKEITDKIISKIALYPQILGIHDLIVHDYGVNKIFASLHAEVDYKVNILDSHEVIDDIEKAFLADNINMIIHMDPVVNDEKTNAIKEKVINALNEYDCKLKVHDFRMVWGENHKNLIFDVLVSFDQKKSDNILKDEICSVVQSIDPTFNCVLTIDRDYTASIL